MYKSLILLIVISIYFLFRYAFITLFNFNIFIVILTLLLFFCFPLLFFIRSRELYRNSIPSALFTGAIEPLLKVLGIVLVVGLLGVVIYGAIQIKKKSVAVYLASVADWCSYPVLRLFSVAHLGAFSPAATIRHSLVYLSLTRRVSLSESETGFQRSAWARVGYLTFLVGIPLGLGFAWAEVKIFAEIVRQNGQSPLSIWGPEFFLFTLHGVIALNHFDTEIYAWRFREPGIANRILPSIQSW